MDGHILTIIIIVRSMQLEFTHTSFIIIENVITITIFSVYHIF